MGYVTLICLILTLLALIVSTLLGLLRGRNHSILRLGIVIASAVGAILLCRTVGKLLLGIRISGQTVPEMILAAIANGGATVPQSLQNVVVALVEIIFSIVSYLLLFYLIRLLSWITIYPICKIFVPEGENKHRFWGALIGFIQGLVVALCALSPMTGLVAQVDEVSKIKVDGDRPLFVVSEQIGLEQYHQSFLGKTYIAIGDWYFSFVSTTTTPDGTTIDIHDSVDIVKMALSLMNTVPEVSSNINTLKQPSATYHQKAESLSSIGDALIGMGNNIDKLSSGAKETINSIIDEVVDSIPSEDLPEEVVDLLGGITADNVNLVGVGESIKGISDFIDKVEISNTPNEVTQEDIDLIVHGLSLNPTMTNTLASMTSDGLIDVANMGFATQFQTAIDTVEDAQTKTSLLKLFGLN